MRSAIVFLLMLLPLHALADVPPLDLEKAKEAAQISDPDEATRAYLDAVPAERRAKTKSYAHGNYVLDIAGTLFTVAMMIALLGLGLSAKMRNTARRITSKRPLQNALYWTQFSVITSLISFPLTIYRSYYREKAYGLLTQSLGFWLTDQLKELLIGIVLGSLFIMLLYGVLRRAPRTWWIWGSAVCIAFLIFGIAIAPVFIQPIFNKVTPIKDTELRENLLNMAHREGIPADEVYEMDASKRTDRISAYVAGLLGTMRIVMFDNTLRRCTHEEIEMIMGHEMGHYVMNHVWKAVGFFGFMILLAFLFVRWAFAKAVARWPSWQVESVADVAGLPLLLVLLTLFLFVISPIGNTYSRTMEDHADDFGLRASNEPDAAATTFLKLGEYRDLEPHPVIEALLYDHPSGRYRIHNAMLYKRVHR